MILRLPSPLYLSLVTALLMAAPSLAGEATVSQTTQVFDPKEFLKKELSQQPSAAVCSNDDLCLRIWKDFASRAVPVRSSRAARSVYFLSVATHAWNPSYPIDRIMDIYTDKLIEAKLNYEQAIVAPALQLIDAATMVDVPGIAAVANIAIGQVDPVMAVQLSLDLGLPTHFVMPNDKPTFGELYSLADSTMAGETAFWHEPSVDMVPGAGIDTLLYGAGSLLSFAKEGFPGTGDLHPEVGTGRISQMDMRATPDAGSCFSICKDSAESRYWQGLISAGVQIGLAAVLTPPADILSGVNGTKDAILAYMKLKDELKTCTAMCNQPAPTPATPAPTPATPAPPPQPTSPGSPEPTHPDPKDGGPIIIAGGPGDDDGPKPGTAVAMPANPDSPPVNDTPGILRGSGPNGPSIPLVQHEQGDDTPRFGRPRPGDPVAGWEGIVADDTSNVPVLPRGLRKRPSLVDPVIGFGDNFGDAGLSAFKLPHPETIDPYELLLGRKFERDSLGWVLDGQALGRLMTVQGR